MNSEDTSAATPSEPEDDDWRDLRVGGPLHQLLTHWFEEPLNRVDARAAVDTALSAVWRRERYLKDTAAAAHSYTEVRHALHYATAALSDFVDRETIEPGPGDLEALATAEDVLLRYLTSAASSGPAATPEPEDGKSYVEGEPNCTVRLSEPQDSDAVPWHGSDDVPGFDKRFFQRLGDACAELSVVRAERDQLSGMLRAMARRVGEQRRHEMQMVDQWVATIDDLSADRDAVRAELSAVRARLDRHRAALAELVRLKDGPRDAAYERDKPAAWAEARAVLADRTEE